MVVTLSFSMLRTKFVYVEGTPRFLGLCSSLSGFAFGKAPSLSRNRTEATFPALRAALTLLVKNCMSSEGVRPGLLPKCLAGAFQ